MVGYNTITQCKSQMPENWKEDQPIYRQLRDRVSGLIMDGTFAEEEAIPSVRTVAAEQQINHLTVAKAYQALVDIGVLEMKRGRGMFVLAGARKTLFDLERRKFEADEVPAIRSRLQMLGISMEQFISLLRASK